MQLVKVKVTFTEALCRKLEADAKLNAEARSCTGSLAVHPKSRDIKIDNFSITFHGSEMLQDAMLELNCGRRYGLLGPNGCGKDILLWDCIFQFEIVVELLTNNNLL